MKKIIKNKVYDTDKAMKCASFENHSDKSAPDWYCETLYKKKTGEFFIHATGNSESRYSRDYGYKNRKGIENIFPVSFNEAHDWAKENCKLEELSLVFGDPSESGKAAIHIYLEKSSIQKVKSKASELDITVSEYIEGLIIQS